MSDTLTKPGSSAQGAASPALNRRAFFKAAGAGAVVAVAPAAVTPAQALDPGSEEKKARYRETEHVKAYYRTNRY
jgi:hypothetical protein